jgi:hypothetical protein
MGVKTLAFILLAGRIVSLIFTGLVLYRQIRLSKLAAPSWLVSFRRVLLGLTLVIFIGNFIPMVIDILVLVDEVQRNSPNPVGVAYALDSNLTAVFASIAIWSLYKLAQKSIERGDEV